MALGKNSNPNNPIMSESAPTPEADSKAVVRTFVPLEDAQKLERERDEARAVNMADYTEAGWTRAGEIEAERDAALAEMKRLKSEGMMLPYAKLEMQAACARLSGEVNRLKLELEELKSERSSPNTTWDDTVEIVALKKEVERLKEEQELYAGWSRWKEGIWHVNHPDIGPSADWVCTKEEYDALKADKARLDWLDEHSLEIHCTLARVLDCDYTYSVRDVLDREMKGAQ